MRLRWVLPQTFLASSIAANCDERRSEVKKEEVFVTLETAT